MGPTLLDFGDAFTKYFHNSSTIIHSTTLPQANPDAPNSSKRGRIVEELWENCRQILRALDRQRSGEELWKSRPGAKSFYNSSTILPRRAAGRGPAKSVYNLSTILPRWLFTLVRKQRFYGDSVEKLEKNLVHDKFGEGFSLLRLTRISRGKTVNARRE
jgi:hypothetical protein